VSSSAKKLKLVVGSRTSSLARAQVDEVLGELKKVHPHVAFNPLWVKTTGDIDLKTSLKTLEKSDFFTRQIDELLLSGACRIAIHSAKDLPDPLPRGLVIVALTRGVDPRDALVFRGKQTLSDVPVGGRIGTSSARREEVIKAVRGDLVCTDIRGTIQSRLSQLDRGLYDGVVIAEAALIRLKLHSRSRLLLSGSTPPLQGKLAVLAREGDEEMRHLFSCIDETHSVPRE
jgi:hydroxymethylbilane synthase